MKRSLTLALVFAVMAAFAGLSAVKGAPQKAKQKSPTTSSGTTTAPTTAPTAAEKATTINTTRSNTFRVATQVMTGKVVSVDKVAKTFTVVANGKQVTFFANKLLLPDVGQMMDIHYIQPTPGGTMEATTIQPTPGGTFAVTNLNSSRSNISRSDNTSATSKAMDPPPEKPKQEVSISESGTMSSYRTATPEQMVTGKVLSVNPKDKTFTVQTNGKQVSFFANKLLLPDVGTMMDIHYIQPTPAGPMEATSIQPTPGGLVAVTNLNSSRSNISKLNNGSTSGGNASTVQIMSQAASATMRPNTPVKKCWCLGGIGKKGSCAAICDCPGDCPYAFEDRTATLEQMVTGKVLSVNPKDKTFTVVANGKPVTFFANKLMLPDVGKMMDIHYIQATPGGPMEATTIQPTPGGTFAVTNLNSSRNNISVAGDTSATSKAIKEPPPQKPKQEVSISESGTMSGFRTATCPNVMTGKVLRVKKEDNTFTVMSKGKEVTFFAGTLNLPKAGEIMDICYTTKNPGGPFTAASVNGSRSNTF